MLKDLLNALLKVLYLRIGAATPTGAAIYSLPTIPVGDTDASTTITAPGDGYFLLRAWNITGGAIYNQTIQYQSENRYLGTGFTPWNPTNNASVYFTVACSKGDSIIVEISALSNVTPAGNVVFFPRVGS